MRTVRMPQIEDFPRPVQEQLRQARGDAAAVDARRKSIFERLATFGASRQESAMEAAPAPAPATQRPFAPAPSHAEYAKRPAPPAPQGGLDQHGRRIAPSRSVEEDHLEIPAFLRRQAGGRE